MKKIIAIIAFILIATAHVEICAISSNNENLKSTVFSDQRRVLSRGTTKLYYNDECITLYSNGTCVLTGGDNKRLEGTYELKDERTWIILYFENQPVSCKITVGRDGSVNTLSFNGYVYRKK